VLSRLVTSLARARLRLFCYPEYDVSKMGLALELHTRSGMKSFAALLSLSQTNGHIRAAGSGPPERWLDHGPPG